MEELNEFCQAGMPITLSSSWKEFEIAKGVLASHGYVQLQSNDAQGLVFVKQNTAEENLQIGFNFPSQVPLPEYVKPEVERGDDQEAHGEWTACPCIQFCHPPDDQLQTKEAWIPKGSLIIKKQTVGIKVKIQPFAKVDQAQLYIKLHIASLVVGVPKRDFLTDKISLGYYPDFISIQLEPELAGSSNAPAVAIPTYVDHLGDLRTPSSASVKHTSATTIGCKVGFSPAFTLQHSRSKECEAHDDKYSLVPVESDNANAASFEWTILRWGNGTEYAADRPHSICSFPFITPPKLPFTGTNTVARLDKFPDAVWHLRRDLKDKPLKFGLCLQFQMRLLWFVGSTVFFRSTGSAAAPMQFEHEFVVKLP